jgi:hypothetical protein
MHDLISKSMPIKEGGLTWHLERTSFSKGWKSFSKDGELPYKRGQKEDTGEVGQGWVEGHHMPDWMNRCHPESNGETIDSCSRVESLSNGVILTEVGRYKGKKMESRKVSGSIWVLEISWKILSWALVAHACNPSYSGTGDQEDCSLKPAWAYSSWDPISKTLHKKGACGVAQGLGPEFKPQYWKKSTANIKYQNFQTILNRHPHKLITEFA